MRWEDERYVRVYTRDTPEWSALSWEARAVFWGLLRRCDRAGILQVGKAGVRALAGVIPAPLEVVERAVPELLADGCLQQKEGAYFVPNFMEAQEAHTSDAQRKRDQRERDRARVAAQGISASPSAADKMAVLQREKTGTLYLIRSGDTYKVGFTERDVEERIRQYASHNPDVTLLATREGTTTDEREAHRILGATTRADEWVTPTPIALENIRLAFGLRDEKSHPEVTHGHAASPEVTESHSVPSRAVPSRKTLRAAPAAPLEGEDPAYKAFVAALFVIFRENRGRDPQPDGKNWKALQRLRERHEPAEIIRRWGHGVKATYKRRCSSFVDLEAKWDECGDAEPPATGQRRPTGADPNQGILTRERVETAEEIEEANRRAEEWVNG